MSPGELLGIVASALQASVECGRVCVADVTITARDNTQKSKFPDINAGYAVDICRNDNYIASIHVNPHNFTTYMTDGYKYSVDGRIDANLIVSFLVCAIVERPYTGIGDARRLSTWTKKDHIRVTIINDSVLYFHVYGKLEWATIFAPRKSQESIAMALFVATWKAGTSYDRFKFKICDIEALTQENHGLTFKIKA